MSPKSHLGDELSIGALADATGLGVERIRMWERRYGYPQAIRRPSGHRRYPIDEVKRLKAIKKALELGYRAGDIAKSSIEELETLVDTPIPQPTPQLAPLRLQTAHDPQVATWVKYAKQLDETKLTVEFLQSWNEIGMLKFMSTKLIPLLRLLAEHREQGKISDSEEHFTSERIADFLSSKWRQMNNNSQGEPIVLASLPGDIHRLGLQMCACVIALANRRVVFIGTSSPIDEIVKTVKKVSAAVVCVSITNSLTKAHAKDCLFQLIRGLPKQVAVVVGGAGSVVADELRKTSPCPLTRITDFDTFYEWIIEQR